MFSNTNTKRLSQIRKRIQIVTRFGRRHLDTRKQLSLINVSSLLKIFIYGYNFFQLYTILLVFY
jgi:hypothetical protein